MAHTHSPFSGLTGFVRRCRAALPGITCLWTSVACAQGPARQEFILHWNVTNLGTHTPLSDQVDFAGAPIQRDVVIFYTHQLGNFPAQGPQPTAFNSKVLGDHLNKVRADVADMIPDPNYTGLAVIDYESWLPLYFISGPAVQRDWSAYMERYQSARLAGLTGESRRDAIEAAYDAAAREFYEQTIRACREVRPRAKWTYYGLPVNWQGGVFGRPDPNPYRAANDRMAWLWELEDFIAPFIYSWFYTVPDGQRPAPGVEWSHAHFQEYITGTVTEARRLALGKPVLPYTWHCYLSGPRAGQPLRGDSMMETLDLTKSAGADGVVLWGDIRTLAAKATLQSYYDSYVFPRARALATGASEHRYFTALNAQYGLEGAQLVLSPDGSMASGMAPRRTSAPALGLGRDGPTGPDTGPPRSRAVLPLSTRAPTGRTSSSAVHDNLRSGVQTFTNPRAHSGPAANTPAAKALARARKLADAETDRHDDFADVQTFYGGACRDNDPR